MQLKRNTKDGEGGFPASSGFSNLRKHPCLLALHRRGRFAPGAKSEEKRIFSQVTVSPVASSADAGYGCGHVEDNDDDDEDVSLLICSSTILTEIHFKSS